MIFLDGLPETLNVDGAEYQINTDYRAILKYDRMLSGEVEGKTIYEALKLIYVQVPGNVDAAITAANWFVNCGRKEPKSAPPNKVLGINGNKAFDFEEDELLIWSAFRSRYGIDLLEVEHLHWWKFRALLDDIGDDARLSRVMQYRVVDTNADGITKERKKFLEAMQRYYKITEEAEERDEEFIQALLNGEDISEFLNKGE